MANVKATDLIEYTRASKGHALAKISYGEELVTNGDFSTDSNWAKGTGWSISGGVASRGAQSGSTACDQAISLVAGKVYLVTYTLNSLSGGNFQTRFLGGTQQQGATRTSAGTYEDIFVALAGNNTVRLVATVAGTVVEVDNVSVKEVLFNQADGTLQLFEHPNNIPRIEYDADGNLLGLLIEESRTNQFIQSENFISSAWGKARAVLVKDAVGPTGVANSAVTLSDNASGNSSTVYISETVTGLTTGNDYTFSVFAKKGSLNFLGLKAASMGLASGQAYFDLANGTLGNIGSDLTATIKDYGNGWYRCSITFTATSDTAGTMRIQMWEKIAGGNFLHDGTKNILIFGAQFEEGSFPTSYIKTTGSTATRSADVASIDVDQFGYNQSEGTVTVTGRSYEPGNDNYFFEMAEDAANRNFIKCADASHFVATSSSVLQANIDAGTITANTEAKLAVAIKADNFGVSLDGGAVVTDTSGTPKLNVSEFRIGSNRSGGEPLNGHIKSIKYFPKRLSNAKLQELTS